MSARKRRREIGAAMANARRQAVWRALAVELDHLEGNDLWRAEPVSEFYDHALIRQHIDDLRRLRRAGEVGALVPLLEESLYRHMTDISAPPLYQKTHTGETKRLVAEYLEETCSTIEALVRGVQPRIGESEKLGRLERAARNFGGSCLMLSGGATWGLYHVGVVQALHGQDLLPRVVCGSSMGAVVAAAVCTRSDAELAAMLGNLSTVHTRPLARFGVGEALRRRAVMDPAQLQEHIRANVGDLTFAEAFTTSGRALNISVSPTRARQKPRVLSHLTTPDVLVWSAAAASCAVPGLFPPARLMARDPSGAVVPYAPDERWVDGSIQGDLPKARVGRLHNVNHFIVSQMNPHVVPFLSNKDQAGVTRLGLAVGGTLVRGQARLLLDLTRRSVQSDRLRTVLDQAHSLAGQDYAGDVNIHPRFQVSMYRRVLTNVSVDQLRAFCVGGAQATWPHLARVRDTTRIARTLERMVGLLKQPPGGSSSAP